MTIIGSAINLAGISPRDVEAFDKGISFDLTRIEQMSRQGVSKRSTSSQARELAHPTPLLQNPETSRKNQAVSCRTTGKRMSMSSQG